MVGTIRVKIALNVNEAFQGILRCATHVETIPLSLKFVELLPLNELSKKKFGRTTVLEPLPTKHESDLDVTAIHMLLTTMQTALILTDREGQLFVFRSHSATAVTIAPYSVLTKQSSRLIASPSNDKESDKEIDEKGEVQAITTGSEEHKLVLDKLAWFSVLQETNDVPTSENLQRAHQACVERNDPTPLHLVTQMIPSAILGTTGLIDTEQLNLIVSRLWLTITAVQGRLRDPNRDKEKVLRVIQVQLLLRLQMLAMDATSFLQLYSTKLMEHRKRKASIPTDVMTHIIAIVEQAPFLLGLDKTLLQFLQETIAPSIYCSIPDQVQEIFDFFECSNPFVSDDDDDDTHLSSVIEGETSDPPKKKVRITTEPAMSKDKDRILEQIDLTSNLGRRTNPLLKDARGVYVGSHFNTKLANMTAHYHEVQHVDTLRSVSSRGKVSPPKKAAVPLKGAIKNRSNAHRSQHIPRASRQDSPFARRGRNTTFDMNNVSTEAHKNDLFVKNTPIKFDKSVYDLFKNIVKDDPSATVINSGNHIFGDARIKPDINPEDIFFGSTPSKNRLIVGETPVKIDNKENRVVSFGLPSNRTPFSVSNHADPHANQKMLFKSGKSSSSTDARLVAQQALSATRRSKLSSELVDRRMFEVKLKNDA